MKIGDKIRVVRPQCHFDDYGVGSIGTITNIEKHGVDVSWDQPYCNSELGESNRCTYLFNSEYEMVLNNGMRMYTAFWKAPERSKQIWPAVAKDHVIPGLTLRALLVMVPDSSDEDVNGIACLEVGQRYLYDDKGNYVERTA